MTGSNYLVTIHLKWNKLPEQYPRLLKASFHQPQRPFMSDLSCALQVVTRKHRIIRKTVEKKGKQKNPLAMHSGVATPKAIVTC
jgi:hypothetical protein